MEFCKVILTFESLGKILCCYHWNETSLAKRKLSTTVFSLFSALHKVKFGNFVEFWRWLLLGVQGLKVAKINFLITWQPNQAGLGIPISWAGTPANTTIPPFSLAWPARRIKPTTLLVRLKSHLHKTSQPSSCNQQHSLSSFVWGQRPFFRSRGYRLNKQVGLLFRDVMTITTIL